jgi:ABC-type polar amino acid transport system ATPase subunit
MPKSFSVNYNSGRNQRIAIMEEMSPDSEILTFDAPEPRLDPKKRKSQLEKRGIPKRERRELTEIERIQADELASEFSSFLTRKKDEDFWNDAGF